MSEVRVNKLSPRSGTTVTLGDSGDTITIPSGVTLANSGTFTNFQSTGINDNATSTAITINSLQHVELHGGQIESNNNTSSITYSGGNNSNAGANLTLFGGSHATTPNVARFRSSATEVMRIDSSGNVGIGTTNTSPRLYVVSNSNENGMILDCVGTPSNYHFDVRNDNSSIFRIDSSGKVGIGVTNLTRNLAIGTLGTKTDTSTKYVMNIGQTSEASSHAGLGVYFVGAASASNRKWQFQPTENGVANDGIIEFNTSGGRFKAVNGIQLGGDTDANKLDDYEEGTFTPILRGSPSPTSVTYSHQVGKYTKVGNKVTVNYYLETNGYSGGGGTLELGGLPFTVASPTYNWSVGSITFYQVAQFTETVARAVANSTDLTVFGRDTLTTSGTWSSKNLSDWRTSGISAAMATVTYFID